MKNKKSGFTLIEMLVVIAIIGTLLGLTIFGIGKAMESSAATKRNSAVKLVNNAVMAYYHANNVYPFDGGGALEETDSNASTNYKKRSYTFGEVSSGTCKYNNGELMLNLFGRDSSGKRDNTKKEYLTAELFDVRTSSGASYNLQDAINRKKLTSDCNIGFIVKLNNRKHSKHGARMFAPLILRFNVSDDSYSVSIPSNTNPDSLLD